MFYVMVYGLYGDSACQALFLVGFPLVNRIISRCIAYVFYPIINGNPCFLRHQWAVFFAAINASELSQLVPAARNYTGIPDAMAGSPRRSGAVAAA